MNRQEKKMFYLKLSQTMECYTSCKSMFMKYSMMWETPKVYDELKGKMKIQKLAFNVQIRHSSEIIFAFILVV